MPYSMDEYLKSLLRMRSNYQSSGNPLINTQDDSTNVGQELSSFAYMNTAIPMPEQASKRVGGNALQKTFGTIDELASEFGSGFVNGWEGALDLGANALGWIFDNDAFNDWARQDIGRSLADYTKTYANLTPWGIGGNIANGNYADRDWWGNAIGGLGDILTASTGGWDENQIVQSVLTGGASALVAGVGSLLTMLGNEIGGTQKTIDSTIDDDYKEHTKENYAFESGEWLHNSEAGNFIGGVTHSIGEMLPSIMIGNAVGGAIKGAGGTVNAIKYGAKGASTGFMALSSAGHGANEALEAGASKGKALAYGAVSGTIEAGTEWIFPDGGVGGSNVGKSLKGKVVKELAKEMFEEGAEEVVSELLSPLARRIYDDDSMQDYFKADYWKGVGIAGLSGAVSGGIVSSVSGARNKTRYGKATQVTENYETISNLQEEYNKKGTTDARKEQIKNDIVELSKQNETILTEMENSTDPKVKKQYQNYIDYIKQENASTFKREIKEAVRNQNDSQIQPMENATQVEANQDFIDEGSKFSVKSRVDERALERTKFRNESNDYYKVAYKDGQFVLDEKGTATLDVQRFEKQSNLKAQDVIKKLNINPAMLKTVNNYIRGNSMSALLNYLVKQTNLSEAQIVARLGYDAIIGNDNVIKGGNLQGKLIDLAKENNNENGNKSIITSKYDLSKEKGRKSYLEEAESQGAYTTRKLGALSIFDKKFKVQANKEIKIINKNAYTKSMSAIETKMKHYGLDIPVRFAIANDAVGTDVEEYINDKEMVIFLDNAQTSPETLALHAYVHWSRVNDPYNYANAETMIRDMLADLEMVDYQNYDRFEKIFYSRYAELLENYEGDMDRAIEELTADTLSLRLNEGKQFGASTEDIQDFINDYWDVAERNGVTDWHYYEDDRGNQMTKSQVDYFKNSKLRDWDDNGKLKVVYNATDNDFNNFDLDRIGTGAGSAMGWGFYFADSPDIATIYGKSGGRPFYLDIRKPLYSNKKTFNNDKLKSFVNALNKKLGYDIMEFYGKYYEKNVNSLEDLYEADNDVKILEVLRNATKDDLMPKDFLQMIVDITGYDGVIGYDFMGKNQFTIFSPTQAKSIYNLHPTKDSDNVRFSVAPKKVISDIKRQSSTTLIEAGADVSKQVKVRINSVKQAFNVAIKEVVPPNSTISIDFADIKSAFAEINLSKQKDLNTVADNITAYIKRAEVKLNSVTGTELQGKQIKYKLGDLLTADQIQQARNIALYTLMGKAEPTKLAQWAKSLEIAKIKGKENVSSMKKLSRLTKRIANAQKNYFGAPNVATGEIGIYNKLIEGVKAPFTNASLIALTDNIARYYNEENIGAKLNEFGIETDNYLRQLSMNLADSIQKGKPLTARQIIMANNILTLIDNEVKQFNRASKENHIAIARPVVVLAQSMNYKAPTGKVSILLQNINWSTLSPVNILENKLGADNPFTVHIRDGGKECANRQQAVRTEWSKALTEEYLKEANMKDLHSLNDKVDAFEKVSKDYAMALLSTIESVGIEQVQKYGFVYQYKNGNYSQTYYPTQADYEALKQALGNENTYREIVRDKFFGKTTRNYANSKMHEIAGIGLEGMVDIYFPTSRQGDKQADFKSRNGSIDPTNWGLRFLKERTHSSQPFVIKQFTNAVNSYIEQLTQWGEWAQWYQTLKVMENTKVFGTTFTKLMRQNFGTQVWDKLMEFVHKTALGMPLTTKITFAGNIFDKAFGNLQQVAMLDLFTQVKTLGSMATLYQFFGTEIGLQGEIQYVKNKGAFGDKRSYDVIRQYSPTLEQRFKSNIAFSANLSKEVKGKVSRVLSSVVRTLDMHIHVGKAFAMAQIMAQKEGYGSPWSETNNQRAVKILERASDTTQPTTSKFNVGMYRAGANGVIVKRMFGMFASMGQNIYQGLYNITVGWYNGVKRISMLEQASTYQQSRIEHYTQEAEKARADLDNASTVEEFEEAQNRLNEAEYKIKEHTISKETVDTQLEQHKKIYTTKKWLDKAIGYLMGLLGSGLILTLIAELKKRVYGKKEWGDIDIKELGKEASWQTFVNWIPYIGTFANAIKNDTDVTIFTMSNINDAIGNATNLFNAIKDGDAGKITGSVMKLGMLFGALCGFPMESVWKLANGIWYNIDKDTNITAQNWLGMYSNSYMKAQYQDAVKKGQHDKAFANMQVWLYNNAFNASNSEIDEIYRLNNAGYSGITPSAIPSSYVDENGTEIKLTSAQASEFRAIYSQASVQAQELIKSSAYKSLDDEYKAKALKRIYTAYYELAKNAVFGTAPSGKLATIMYKTNGDIDLAKYILSLQQLATVKETKTKSRKELVLAEINKMKGYSKQEKLLLAYLSGYTPNESNKNMLVSYLTKIGFTRKEALSFLK